ncbi:unnamed protein product [Ectocarpus sp. 12 AP-2014]
MSQQFLSKYFKRPGDNNDGPADSSKKPAAKEKVKRQASPQTGSRGDAPSGGSCCRETSAVKRKKAISSSAGGDTRRSADWQCPECTFNNPAAKRACEMCGGHQVVGGTAAREEIEITGSDSEADADSEGGGIGDDDDDGSDFEDLPIGRNPKRPKTGVGAQGSNKPTSSSSLGKNNERPVGRNHVRPLANKPPGRPKPPPAGGDTCVSVREGGGAAALDGAIEEVQEMGEERGRARGGDSSSKGGPDDSSSSSSSSNNSSRLAVFGGGRGSGGSSSAVFSAESFALEEDARRRKDFQARLRAALPDDSDDGPSIAAAGSGGNSSTGDNGAPGGGLGTATGAGGGASSSSSRGKRKAAAAAAAKVKLTPMEQQVVDLKAKYPGVLLLVECGYRYRFFGDDALAAAKVLRIYAHMDHNFQVASVPTFRLAVHLRRLVDAGYKARDQLRVNRLSHRVSIAPHTYGTICISLVVWCGNFGRVQKLGWWYLSLKASFWHNRRRSSINTVLRRGTLSSVAVFLPSGSIPETLHRSFLRLMLESPCCDLISTDVPLGGSRSTSRVRCAKGGRLDGDRQEVWHLQA